MGGGTEEDIRTCGTIKWVVAQNEAQVMLVKAVWEIRNE